MIQENASGSLLSSLLVSDHFLEPDDRDTALLLDYESGPIALNNTSEGLFYQAWTCRYFPDTNEFVVEAPNTAQTVVHTAPDVSELSFTFDQNANPFITYVEDGDAKFWWWDTAQGDYAISALPANTLTPRCTHDDKRQSQSGSSDILLCYVTNGALLMRQERDRYTIQYTLQDPFLHPVYDLPAVIKRFGMNKKNRVQWLCDLANPIDWCGYVNYGN